MDMKAAIEALGITREEIVQRAAQIMADDAASDNYIGDSARALIKDKVEKLVAEAAPAHIHAVLSTELERLLENVYTPVDIFGDATGKPTTLRHSLLEQAKTYWEVKVDKDGRNSSYGGKPRYLWIFENIVGDEFKKAVAQNITTIVGAIKDALKEDARAQIDKHIDTIIKVTTANDKPTR